ncbi:unnamed protein product [Oncorhynchus mykiss]|uniref:C2H2-type domain-containing protein n=1 Tax=Oncorhynchus mykiss TaxID=8022 RepID=A0A060WWK4_ONCMY|nr:unnamed protein product [Oncorhynchus mykiss]
MPRGRPRKLRDKTNDGTEGISGAKQDNSHGDSKDNKCTVCSQSFTTESQLQRHQRDHEANDKASIVQRARLGCLTQHWHPG